MSSDYGKNRRNPNWIAFSGLKGSGKDTAGDWAVTVYGFKKTALAKPLKKACKAIFRFSNEQLEDEKLKEVVDQRWGFSPRTALQKIGTDICRNELPKYLPLPNEWDVWCTSFLLWFKEQLKKNPDIKICACDVRFHDQEEFVQSLGFVVIKIERDGLEVQTGALSEVSVAGVKGDVLIYNNGKDIALYKQELEQKVGPVMNGTHDLFKEK